MGKTYPRVTELLKKEFEEKGVTKYAFCKETGINPTSVERYLCGISEPNQSSLERLAGYFKVSVSWLRGESATENMVREMDKIIEIDRAFSVKDYRNSVKWKELRTQYNMELVLEIEDGIKKFPDLWTAYNAIPKEQKKEAVDFLNKYDSSLEDIGKDIFKNRNKP